LYIFVFFFQAEDGIRDRNVTGVQTCALPIWGCACRAERAGPGVAIASPAPRTMPEWSAPCESVGVDQRRDQPLVDGPTVGHQPRSEERRVGKGCRSRGVRARGGERVGTRSRV